MRQHSDFLVVGAGIAGSSVAYELSKHASVLLIERESQAGYHTTGRSAAVYTEIYGNDVIRHLTIASGTFFADPPSQFSESVLWSPRPVIMIGREDQLGDIGALHEHAIKLAPEVRLVDACELKQQAGMLKPGYAAAGLMDPNSRDLDVHSIHFGFLRAARKQGCEFVRDANVRSIERDGGWKIETTAGTMTGRVLVNAAGAWADVVAELAGVRPVGLVPKRRSAFVFMPQPASDVRHWPVIIDVAETFYFKPDAGRLLGSPADETPSPPCDAQPDDIDIAIAIDRICKAADFSIPTIENKWAGLRSFVADKTPVVGFDDQIEDFFWLAGQGGYGIQTSPAMARAASRLALRKSLPEDLLRFEIDERMLSPSRLRHGVAS